MFYIEYINFAVHRQYKRLPALLMYKEKHDIAWITVFPPYVG